MPTQLTQGRKLALEITHIVRKRNAYAREIINSKRESVQIPESEFAFAQVLSFGVVMCKGTLDEFINRSLRRLRDLKPNMRDALRISAYEILFLKKPEHVVLSQGVMLACCVTPKASKMAKSIISKMIKDACNFPKYDSSNEVEICARSGGMPIWMTEKFISQYGIEKTKEMFECNIAPAPKFMVDNPYKQGSKFASDISAQKVAQFINVGGDVLEIGSGRGTKTMLIQRKSYVEEVKTNIFAVDIHEFKKEILLARMEEENIPNVKAYAADARDLSTLKDLPCEFDCVFVDAPCSGTGTLRRHPEIRWNLQPDDLDALVKIQLELLQEASKKVKSQCNLIYSTCSILKEENSDVVDAFFKSEYGKNFEIAQDFFFTFPEKGGGDGHFAAVLRRV